jgi:hypothetical protein
MGQIALTFFGFSLAAPHFVLLPLPEGVVMRDFRTFDMPVLGIVAVLVWLGLVATAAYASLRDPQRRPLAWALLAAIVFNFLLHRSVQFRGSLFIYTPHIWVAIVALVAVGTAAWRPSDFRYQWALRVALIFVLLVIAPMNFSRAFETATLFDRNEAFTVPAHSR